MKTTAIVIPLYLENPPAQDLCVLNNLFSVLTSFDFIAIIPQGLSLRQYQSTISKHSISLSTIEFQRHYFTNVKSYSALLLTPKFYQCFSEYTHILIFQTDAWIFKNELQYWCNQPWSYIGAPWFENYGQNGNLWATGNGGFSLRKISDASRFLDLIDSYRTNPILYKNILALYPTNSLIHIYLKLLIDSNPEDSSYWNLLPNEDAFWGFVAPAICPGYAVAPPNIALKFSFECGPRELFTLNQGQLPFGCHAFEKYDPEFWKQFIPLLDSSSVTQLFTVATSIAPKGLELQRKAIASWRRLGFAVISFNNTAEVELLAPQFPEVRFVTVARDGRARAGKPLVYVQDMLAWFRENREIRYGGFINSDIVVAPEQPDAFLALLQREIGGSLIFSRRIEVENIDRLEGKWNRTGIDLWLWDREILHCYTEPADYMVGFPHWDYYMELLPICHGIPVKQLAIANAYHQTHDAYYDWVRDAVPYALQTFKLIYPHLSKIPDQDHLLLPTINYCFKHQPAQISSQDDLEFLAMFLNTLDKFFLETIDRCSLKLNYHDLPHVPQDQRLSLCLNPEAYRHPAKSPMATRPSMPSHKTGNTNFALTLGTSLSPKDYDKQKVAIASWKALGIDVISFNGAAEVAALSPLYPEVRFITLARDGSALAGRPLVYVDDIIAYFRESGLQLAGFINADIILKPSQPEVFKQLILEQSKRSMLFARRVDIASPAAMDSFWQDLQGTWIRSGIDLWIFDTAMLREYRHQTDYLVGYPHWDFFMCLWPLAQGFSLKELSVPCIFHPVHTQQYDFSNQMRYAMKTYMHIAPLLDRFPVLDRALLNFVQYFAQNQPVRSDDGPGSQFYNSFRYALDIFFLETIFSNCRRVSYAHVDGAQDDIVPGFNHPLHSFGTLEVVLHRMENP